MNDYRSLLLLGLARFQALSVPQLLRICQGQISQATAYRTLKIFRRRGLATRLIHPDDNVFAYGPTKETHAFIYGEQSIPYQEARMRDLAHAVACTETFISLAQRKNVTGIMLEHELSRKAVPTFCHNRRPDGIFQITNGATFIELAVEVELSRKTDAEVESVLRNYETTFNERMPCSGVLIVAPDPYVFEKYQERVEKLPKDIERRVILLSSCELSELNSNIYGPPENNLRVSLERIKNHSQSHLPYAPILSRVYPKIADPRYAQVRGSITK